MLIYQRPRVVAGRIACPFERLPVAVGACSGIATGTAHIGYDGRGAWWVDQIEISNPREPGPDVFLPVSDPLFAEIRERLAQYRDDDIAECIERALAGGQHQRLFDEQPPHIEHRRGAPPHARRTAAHEAGRQLVDTLRGLSRPGRITTAVLQVGGTAAEVTCPALALAGLLCWGLPDTSAHGARHRSAGAVVARLAETERRP